MITLNLTEQETNTVLAALGDLPAKQSMQLILKIMEQGRSQLKKKESDDAVQAERPQQERA